MAKWSPLPNDQHLAANAPMQQAVDTEQQAQAVAADEKIEIAKKEDKDKDGRDNQNAETIQLSAKRAAQIPKRWRKAIMPMPSKTRRLQLSRGHI